MRKEGGGKHGSGEDAIHPFRRHGARRVQRTDARWRRFYALIRRVSGDPVRMESIFSFQAGGVIYSIQLLGGSGAFSIVQIRLKQPTSLHRPPVQLCILSPPFLPGLLLVLVQVCGLWHPLGTL